MTAASRATLAPSGHYENFPVASWLCPPHLRTPIRAIYAFARTADDIADEGDAPAGRRLADLQAFRAELHAMQHGAATSRWPRVFGPLAAVVAQHRLPVPLLDALLDAFIQDVSVGAYADRAAVLDYCRRSADPVGRLLLHLYGIDDPHALAWSDAICSGLQLANFWQDLSVDLPRGRCYVPDVDARRHGIEPGALRDAGDVPAAARAALVGDLVAWARGLLLQGSPLVHAVPGRAGVELRFVVQGGLAICEKVERLGPRVFHRRPTIGALDAPRLAWRALAMRARRGATPLDRAATP